MSCIALVRCVLVLLCGLAGVVWYPYADFSLHTDTDTDISYNEVHEVLKCTVFRMFISEKMCPDTWCVVHAAEVTEGRKFNINILNIQT